MKRRLICLAFALGLLTLAVKLSWPAAPPQIITLWDGRQYQFAGATWGTNHSQPRLLAQVIDSLPTNWAAHARAKLNPRYTLDPPLSTANPTLMVWLKLVGSNVVSAMYASNHPISLQYGSLTTTLADETGLRSGQPSSFIPYVENPWLPGGYYGFEVVPRRSRMLEYDFFYPDAGNNPNTNVVGHFKFANPAFGHFPQWQPEPLPAVKSTGDLRVRLNSFTVQPPARPFDSWIISLSLSLHLANGTNDTWGVDDLTLSDATGNRLEAFHPTPLPDGTYQIGGGLWPSESAWKLKVALKRTNGIPPADLITFTNLPVLPAATANWGKDTFMTNLSHGAPVVIDNYFRGGGSSWIFEGYWVNLETSSRESRDLAVDILNVTTDAGDPPPPNQGSLGRHFKTLPYGAKTYTVTVAAQKPRSVEFLIKPPPMTAN